MSELIYLSVVDVVYGDHTSVTSALQWRWNDLAGNEHYIKFCFSKFLIVYYTSVRPIDGAGSIKFSDCPSVCACVYTSCVPRLSKLPNRDIFAAVRRILMKFGTVTYLPPGADRTLIFRVSANQRWRRPTSWKSKKSQHLRNGLTILTKFGALVDNGSLDGAVRVAQ